MSWGGITNFWQENNKKWKFPLDLLFLLDCTHYHGDWWLYIAEVYVWPPRGLKVPPRGGFILGEVQAMSQGGILIFGRKKKKKENFPLHFLCLLYYTHYHGEWSLYHAEDNDWPP